MYYKTATITLTLLIFTCLSSVKSTGDENSNESIKVGIVGAGLTGLYSALLLNELGIDYEILEAADRAGGRIFTYYFDDFNGSNYNYVDLGAMRFPVSSEFDIEIGKQNTSLISFLNNRLPETKKLKLISNILKNENNIFYFNCKKRLRSEIDNCSKTTECFDFGKEEGGFVKDEYLQSQASTLVEEAFDYINEKVYNFGFKYLIDNDFKTFREFLMDPKGLNYDAEIVDWIETLNTESGKFSNSMMDIYLMYHWFSSNLVSIDGGTSKLIDALVSVLKQKPKLNHKVREVKQLPSKELLVKTNTKSAKYSDLILTPTFTALRGIHFGCDISLKKRMAMRTLNYGFSVKVGLSFKSRFWENAKHMNGSPIFGGVSLTDLPIRQIVYPSYGINCTTCPGALLASYVWSRDAKYFLSFSSKEVVNIVLRNLAEIHGPIVHKEYTGKYVVMDWTRNPYAKGAFPKFDPGDFESFFPYLIKPEAKGRMHFAGDTITLNHGWSNGCLTSAFRAVKNILLEHKLHEKVKQLTATWGNVKDPADISEII